jgi:AcrR family transcriptional regulator
VIQAADRLWSERGLRGASLDDIARAASVTKPAIYYYFADKSALFTEVVCSVLEEHGTGLRGAARAGKGALRDGGVALTVDQMSQARSAFFRHFFSPVQQILDDGVRAGELRALDSAFATQALFNLLEPWTTSDPLPGGRSAPALAEELVGLVCDGIAV